MTELLSATVTDWPEAQPRDLVENPPENHRPRRNPAIQPSAKKTFSIRQKLRRSLSQKGSSRLNLGNVNQTFSDGSQPHSECDLIAENFDNASPTICCVTENCNFDSPIKLFGENVQGASSNEPKTRPRSLDSDGQRPETFSGESEPEKMTDSSDLLAEQNLNNGFTMKHKAKKLLNLHQSYRSEAGLNRERNIRVSRVRRHLTLPPDMKHCLEERLKKCDKGMEMIPFSRSEAVPGDGPLDSAGSTRLPLGTPSTCGAERDFMLIQNPFEELDDVSPLAEGQVVEEMDHGTTMPTLERESGNIGDRDPTSNCNGTESCGIANEEPELGISRNHQVLRNTKEVEDINISHLATTDPVVRPTPKLRPVGKLADPEFKPKILTPCVVCLYHHPKKYQE